MKSLADPDEWGVWVYESPCDGVHIDDPDGAYVRRRDDGAVQVVFKGPMPNRPGDYEKLVSGFVGKPMRLYATSFLPNAPGGTAEERRANLLAGFISLIFREGS